MEEISTGLEKKIQTVQILTDFEGKVLIEEILVKIEGKLQMEQILTDTYSNFSKFLPTELFPQIRPKRIPSKSVSLIRSNYPPSKLFLQNVSHPKFFLKIYETFFH